MDYTTKKSESLGTQMLFKNENANADIPDILNYFQVTFLLFFLKKKWTSIK